MNTTPPSPRRHPPPGSRPLANMPHSGEPHAETSRLRALLQEMGVRCDDTAELDDADAILLTSGRGMEALIASRLDDEQRHHAYSRIVARLISVRCTSRSTPRSSTTRSTATIPATGDRLPAGRACATRRGSRRPPEGQTRRVSQLGAFARSDSDDSK